MSFLTKFSLKNAAAVFIISFLLIVGGIYSFSSLKVDLLPNIEFPQISVQVVYPGASPSDINEQVTSKLEGKFKGIADLKTISSSNFENVALVNLEFPFKTDMSKIETQLNTYIKDTKLPDNVQTKINRFSFGSFPIYQFSLFAKGDTDLQKLLNDEVVPELNKVTGINNVTVGGKKEELINITIDKEKAAKLGLSLSAVKDQINQKFLSFPTGTVKEGDLQIPVRVEEKLSTIEELKNMVLKSNFPTAPGQAAPQATLKDLATVNTISKQSESSRYNLKDSISMSVSKKQDANTVQVADAVVKVLDKYKDKMDYSVAYDSASGIKSSVSDLVREGLLGALFASIAVLLFLRNIRATIIAVVSIPLSLLIATIFLARYGISLNIMTLGGMAVAVGRVVDDSIVVIENIFRRARTSKEGMTDNLILVSTKEILKAITSSTITTVVVFLPIGFVGGITGEFFLPFALTVVFSLLASLFVAITIVPILARFAFKKVPKEEKEGALQRWYSDIVVKALNHKLAIIIISILLLGGSFALVPSLGFTFLANEEQKMISASIELPSSTTLEKTNDVSLKIEKMLSTKTDIKEVTATIGGTNFATGLKKANSASYFLNLNSSASTQDVIKDVNKEIETIVSTEAKGTKISVQELSSGGPPSNNNVKIDLYATNLDALQKAAVQVQEYMEKNDNLKGVSNNFSDKQKQLVVKIKSDKASEYDVPGMQILGTVADVTNNVNVGTLKIDGKDQSVQLAYDKNLQSIDDVKNTKVFTKRGPVALSELADVENVDTFTSIQKLDGKIFARVNANIKGDNIQKVSADVISDIKKLDLPSGVSLKSGGGSDETVQIFKDLGLAMLIAIGLVYLTMLITFGKARIPFIILSSLIFVPIGSFLALYVLKEPMSVSVMIGILMLIGIVTTNAIVLVDRIGQNRTEKGLPIREAIVEAGRTRLRPILMTAFATIAALLPLAFTKASGALISKGLAITVIGGLTTSTLLTMIMIPVLYEVFFSREIKKEKKAAQKPAPTIEA